MIPPRTASAPSAEVVMPSGAPSVNARVASILAKMEPPLRKICDDIRSQLAAARRADVSAHHAIALLVREVVLGVPKYGGGAVKQIHLVTGMSVKSLYRWTSVAAAWPTQEALSAVTSLRDQFGLTLTWSHLEEIARIKQEVAREEFVNLAVSMSLSVAEVRARIDERLRQEDATKQSSLTGSHDPLATKVGSLTREIEAVSRIQARWHEAIGQLSGKALSTEAVRALREALASQVKLRDALSEAIKEAEAVLNCDVGEPPLTRPEATRAR